MHLCKPFFYISIILLHLFAKFYGSVGVDFVMNDFSTTEGITFKSFKLNALSDINSLTQLKTFVSNFDGCELKKNATNTVFCDGTCQEFDNHKLKRSIEVAMRKRPTSKEKMDKLINSVMQRLENSHSAKITTRLIGKTVMDALFLFDKVAFVRFNNDCATSKS